MRNTRGKEKTLDPDGFQTHKLMIRSLSGHQIVGKIL